MNVDRQLRDPTSMFLPFPPIPRPGDEVVYYSGAFRGEGVLEGHGPEAKPHVRNQFKNTAVLESFDVIRPKNPLNRRGPAWSYLPKSSRIVVPTQEEEVEFNRLLNRVIPPGPRYIDLIEEIWARGFEVFVVGGTVRDVIAGKKTQDVDLVTTMPLTMASNLLEAMFREKPEIHEANGYVRLGGTPASHDPFIDLKMFSHYLPTAGAAIFGADFERDVAHRDFDCNAVYFDPKNRALIDPTGVGIENAQNQVLNLVCNPEFRSPYNLAQIVVRFFKFLSRGYQPTAQTTLVIREKFIPMFSSMKHGGRISYIRTQVLSKCPKCDHEEKLEVFRLEFIRFGVEELWLEYVEPYKGEILG